MELNWGLTIMGSRLSVAVVLNAEPMKVEHFSFSHYYLSLFEAFAQGRMELSSLNNIDCNPGPCELN